MLVSTASVDGQPVNNWWIDWSSLRAASTVDFKLSGTPIKSPGNAPPSFVP